MQKGRVFLIGFPCHIKDIAHNRNGSSHSVNTDVGYHSEEHSARRAQSNRFIQNIGGQEGPRSIANPQGSGPTGHPAQRDMSYLGFETAHRVGGSVDVCA